MPVVPLSLKDAPALIERALPVQQLSIESYKEQMAGSAKPLTSIGSYWKGRKPLALNRACILGCLLPATDKLERDVEIFEMLMGMDDASLAVRVGSVSPKTVVETVAIKDVRRYFDITPDDGVPENGPINLEDYRDDSGKLPKVMWRKDVPLRGRRILEGKALRGSYKDIVSKASLVEACQHVHDHIWDEVNHHLGTDAHSMAELVEQLGIMRFGHRPKLVDSFCGSGQIPFEAARLGCDVIASDLNPIACLLTWGAMHLVGGSRQTRDSLREAQEELVQRVGEEIVRLGIEPDDDEWRPKVFVYCVEVTCPETGWTVPLLPSRIISKDGNVIVELVPDEEHRRYDLVVRSNVSNEEMIRAGRGTLRNDGEPYLVHTVDGTEYRTRISTLRGDYTKPDGTEGNRLRTWEKTDFMPRPDDIFRERLCAVGWVNPTVRGGKQRAEFRTVTEEDLHRDEIAAEYLRMHLAEWQHNGWIPDMRIEPGYNTRQPIWERGWTYWHHLFNPRQLVVLGLVNRYADFLLRPAFAQLLQYNSRLCMWHNGAGGRTGVQQVFSNQALNTLYIYGCQGWTNAKRYLMTEYKYYPINPNISIKIHSKPADQVNERFDLAVTDPPYGDNVKYEEITEFFIAWLRKNVPSEFSSWIWDSRRSLAITGEGNDFRLRMVAAYKKLADLMNDNGIQVIMFTHKSAAMWADMANIVWASGLQVTAAWYVATETDNPLREGNYVKGTVLLVVRKRKERLRITQDDLAWEIQEEVRKQVELLTGLNQRVKARHRDENIFEDVDLQMAGYAAALRVLTKYEVIDGKHMPAEAMRPRVNGGKTFVDELIEFAVDTANQYLIPQGFTESDWNRLSPIERFYLKLVELEAKGIHTLDNYQNFAKVFKVKEFETVMASTRANTARLKTASEFGRSEMTDTSEFGRTPLRAILYALMELEQDVDGEMVLHHLVMNVEGYYEKRDLLVTITDYLTQKLSDYRPSEAKAARILRQLIRHQGV